MKHRTIALVAAVAIMTVTAGAGNGSGMLASPGAPQSDEPIDGVPALAPLQSRIPVPYEVAIVNSRLRSIDFAVADAAGAPMPVLRLALGAVQCAVTSGDIAAPPTLTLIDYSRPSTEPRLWVFDLNSGALLYRELVAHGRNTGENLAAHFSDEPDSRQSSLGLFVTADTYDGGNGYSLRLDGLEPGFNARARQRAIVMHGAPYVNTEVAATLGHLGRSWGCPALRSAVAHELIDTIRGGGVIFSYYPDSSWLQQSRFLNGCGDMATLVATR